MGTLERVQQPRRKLVEPAEGKHEHDVTGTREAAEQRDRLLARANHVHVARRSGALRHVVAAH